MRRYIPLALALVAAPAAAAAAQSIGDSYLRAGPQYVQYTFKEPVNEKVSELAIPLFFVVPFTPQFTMDLGTAWASTHSEIGGTKSDISGLTDTQLRANYTFGADFVVLTAGLNLPTGQSLVKPAQQAAAIRVGSDFLAFPIPSMGTGFGFTGGLAIAKPVGSWNVGAGASLRKSSAYDPFQDGAGTAYHYQPGNEYRVRVGADRTVGTGRLALGVTYSAFGDNVANGSAYNTGNRLITQGSLTNALGPADLTLAAWDIYRASGTLADNSPLGYDNIANMYVGLGFHAGSATFEPNVELRNWQQEGMLPSTMYRGGLRTQFRVGALVVSPGASYAIGKLATTAQSANMNGFQAVLSGRIGGN